MRGFSILLLSLTACADGEVVVDDKTDTGETADTDTDTGDSVSPYAGDWAGLIDGYAAFNADWETEPYCSGEIAAEAADGGAFIGDGECVILWGPYIGTTFLVELDGSIADDGAISVSVSMADADQTRSWDTATLSGTADATSHTGSATVDTFYNPLGIDPVAAIIVLTLE